MAVIYTAPDEGGFIKKLRSRLALKGKSKAVNQTGQAPNVAPTPFLKGPLIGRAKHIPLMISRRNKIVGGLLLAAILVAGGYGLYHWHANQVAKHKKEVQAKFTATLKQADTTPVPKRGDAIKLLKDQAANTTDPAQQYAVDVRLGTLYYYQKDWQNALKYFEAAQATKQPGAEGMSLYIAVCAENLGDKQKAIQAYNQYIQVLQKQPGPYAQSQIKQYQDKIKVLGG
jgi:tetratricopeptide (TPR) repeat protein